MKALTVQQPWASAIVKGWKPIENRTQLWKHRGTLLIHAGARLSERGCDLIPDLLDQTHPEALAEYAALDLVYGAIIGQVDLVDVHPASLDFGSLEPCCGSPWAERSYVEHGGRVRRQITHLVLEDPQEYSVPIPAIGRLGLWTPPDDVLRRVA